MRVIGLTGGIACGKSTVSHQLSEEYGAMILDADVVAYQLAEPGNMLWSAFIGRYGKERVSRCDGTLNRSAVAEIVFQNPEEKRWMDTTAHPMIRQRLLDELDYCKAQGKQVVVLDVPLLFEVGWETLPTEVWVVYVKAEIQLRRLMERNGISEEMARARIAAQMSLEEKKKRADVVIDNSGSREETMMQVREAFTHLHSES